jgi:hypothetical protein
MREYGARGRADGRIKNQPVVLGQEGLGMQLPLIVKALH